MGEKCWMICRASHGGVITRSWSAPFFPGVRVRRLRWRAWRRWYAPWRHEGLQNFFVLRTAISGPPQWRQRVEGIEHLTVNMTLRNRLTDF